MIKEIINDAREEMRQRANGSSVTVMMRGEIDLHRHSKTTGDWFLHCPIKMMTSQRREKSSCRNSKIHMAILKL